MSSGAKEKKNETDGKRLSAGKEQVENRNDFKIAKQYPLVTKMKDELQRAK